MKRLLIFVMAAAAASSFGQNLLVNPGFEDSDFTGWTVNHAGAFSGIESGEQHSGTYCVDFGALTAGDAEDFSQTISTIVGDSYLVSFWAFDQYTADTTAIAGLTVTFGGDTVFTGIPNNATGTTADYTLYSGTFVATSTSTTLDVNGWEETDWIYADDFNVSPTTPEPASIAALGIGVVALIRRRRKV